MTLNVSLPSELESRVRQRVESGMYSSASEVIREALRLFEAYERVREARLDDLRGEIAKGLADVQSGAVAPTNMADLKQRGREVLKKRKPAA